MASWMTLTTGARQFVVQDAAVSSRWRARIVKLVVDADDDVEGGLVLDGGRHDHPFDAPVKIGLQLIRLQEFSGAFQYDVATEIAPCDVARIGPFAETNSGLSDRNYIFGSGLDRLLPSPMKTVELQRCAVAAIPPFNSFMCTTSSRLPARGSLSGR